MRLFIMQGIHLKEMSSTIRNCWTTRGGAQDRQICKVRTIQIIIKRSSRSPWWSIISSPRRRLIKGTMSNTVPSIILGPKTIWLAVIIEWSLSQWSQNNNRIWHRLLSKTEGYDNNCRGWQLEGPSSVTVTM